jgi:endonuclease III
MRVELIENYLEELLPNPKCELEYSKDYELLIAITLSAQTTDKRVNKVTKVLFNKYDTLEKLRDANIDDLKSIVRELGSYNKKALYIKEIARIIVDDYNGIMPRKRKDLEKMPGVGRKTVNVLFISLILCCFSLSALIYLFFSKILIRSSDLDTLSSRAL